MTMNGENKKILIYDTERYHVRLEYYTLQRKGIKMAFYCLVIEHECEDGMTKPLLIGLN